MAEAKYNIVFARSARKELEELPPLLVNQIFPAIQKLAQNPRPAKCVKLSGRQDLWRVRIGDYRIIYHIDEAKMLVDIVTIRHRRDVYR